MLKKTMVLFSLALLFSAPFSGNIRGGDNGFGDPPPDSWLVNATISETVTSSGAYDSSWSTRITPNQIVKASSVTIVKRNTRRSSRTATAFLSLVVPNEGELPDLVISEAAPSFKRVAGSLREESYQQTIETVNGQTAEYSAREQHEFHAVFTDAHLECEFSQENQVVSVSAWGEGDDRRKKERYEKGAWKTLDPFASKRGGEVSIGLDENPGRWLSRQGDTIHVNSTESKTTRKQDPIFGEVTTTVRRTITATIKPLANDPPQADPGGPYEVTRGKRVVLDGSGSKGNLVSFTWTFAAAGADPALRVDPGPREGQKVEVVAIAPFKATLTVSDGGQSSSRSVTVKVKERPWKTPCEHVGQEGKLDPATAPLIDPHLMAYAGGANVCALDPGSEDGHIFHPGAANGSWSDSGYTLAQVSDPGGPFDSLWYVETCVLRVSRQTQINPYLLPGGRPPLSGIEPWYDFNLKKGAPAAEYLAAVRDHEMEHSRRKIAALPQNDPQKKIEPLIESEREKLQQQADQFIRDAEYAVCEAAKDPLPRTWKGLLWFPKIDTGIYIQGEVEVGGPNQIETPPCKK
jgi:hypothetical protein